MAFTTLSDQLESVPRASASKFVRAQRDVLAQIAAAEKIKPRHVERVAEAQRKLKAGAGRRACRLEAPAGRQPERA